jgi:hypothetical protein
MKKTLAKGGKTEKNMKKQSILNLVNSILLLCTLLFSVISFAWYSPNKDVGTPLSFGAGGAGSMTIHTFRVTDSVYVNGVETKAPQLIKSSGIEFLGASNSAINATALIDFGAIDDLGHLKNSNCAYYCVTINKADVGNDIFLNLSYSHLYSNVDLDSAFTTTPMYSVAQSTEYNYKTGNPFVLTPNTTVTNDQTTITPAIMNTFYDVTTETDTRASFYEEITALEKYDSSDWKKSQTFLHYAYAISDVNPATLTENAASAKILLDMFKTTGNKIDNAIPVSKVDTVPSTQSTEIVLPNDNSTIYLYIKVSTNLDNYAQLAELMMGKMPFYMGFGLRLHVQAQPKAVAE